MTYHHRPFKWASLMLPEHREQLAELLDRQGDAPPPQLDEQQREELDRVLAEAVRRKQPVALRYYRERRYLRAEGWVLSVGQGWLSVREKAGRSLRIRVGELVEIQPL